MAPVRAAMCSRRIPGTVSSLAIALVTSCRLRGDYGFNVFHNSNPQHGGSYARHERRMRDDEVKDFLRSVKGWVPVDDTIAATTTNNNNNNNSCSACEKKEEKDEGPSRLTVFTGEEAIKRDFVFSTYRDAYLFMGRFWAFCYGSDKYPHVVWEGTCITVYLYSPSFRGLSKREARLAAFLNDQYNMFRKSKRQQEQLMRVAVAGTRVEELTGSGVARELRRREEERHKPLEEVKAGMGAAVWETLLDGNSTGRENNKNTP